MLLSGMFCGNDHSFDYPSTSVINIDDVKISDGVYDEVYASNNGLKEFNESSKVWDFDTVLYALFQNNLYGGNVSFTADIVSAMRVKRRKKGTYVWDVLFEIPISSNEDFSFERFDRYARGNTEYEYSLVPVMSGNIEGNLNTNSVKSEFEGFYFIEKEAIYRAFLNIQLSHERNQTGTTVSTLGKKYPYHITNGDNNFNSGTFQATFVDLGLDNELITDGAWKYREAVDDFLTNGNVKIMKNDEGKMWMVAIVDSVSQDLSQHYQMPVHSISWVEVGDCESTDDLFSNNFIDIDSRLVR